MRAIVRFVEAGLLVFLFPAIISIRSARTRELRQRRFHLWSEFLSQCPFTIGFLARRVFYQSTLKKCGVNPVIRMGTIFIHPETEIGNNVFIANYCMIGLCSIGNDVMLAHHVSILSGRHHHHRETADAPLRLQGGNLKRVCVGNDVWIGAGAVVMDDVGDHSIIGAGAVVVKCVPPGSSFVGSSGRIIRNDSDERKNMP